MADDLAPLRPQVYSDPRPASYFERFHRRARTREPDWVYEVARFLVVPYLRVVLRAVCLARDKVPARGPAILAPNHFSFVDHFLVGAFLERQVRFMAKSQLFKPPLQAIISHAGGFPVRRGHADEEAFITANMLLRHDDLVVVYPEGGRSRTGRLADRARPGIGRLALETAAPVIPVAIYGTVRIRNWKRFEFPRVAIQYGDALQFARVERPERERQQEVADQVLAAIKRLYADLARRMSRE